MKLLVNHIGDLLIEFNEESSKLIYHLLNAKCVQDNTWNGKGIEPYTDSKGVEYKPTFRIISDEEVMPKSPMIDKLTAAIKDSDSKWYSQYTENQKLTAELKDLKAKLATFTDAIKEPVKPTSDDTF